MIIYKTKNRLNDKIYIGKACKKSDKYLGSGKWIVRAIKKHGHENFIRTTIDFAENMEDLCRKEIFWIDFYNARNPNVGYNLAPGGRSWGSSCSEETKRKISLAISGIKLSSSHRHKISDSLKERPRAEEIKRKISETLKKRFENKEKHPCFGRHLSEEIKMKISMSLSSSRSRISGSQPEYKGSSPFRDT